MNKVILVGNLTADPELKTYAGDRSMAVFTIAINEGFGDKQKTYFINCVASGKTGEAIAKYFTKGQTIIAAGKLYTSKNEDTGYQETRVAINEFNFAGPKVKKDEPGNDKHDDVPMDDVPF